MMVRVERSIAIAATRRHAFEYVADYGNVLKFMHNVRRFEPVGDNDHGLGSRFYWETVVRGLRLGWEFVVTEFLPFEWMSAEGLGRPRSSSNWRFRAIAGGTMATFCTTMELPRGLLVGRWLVEREVAANMEQSLVNLKARLERGRGGGRREPVATTGAKVS